MPDGHGILYTSIRNEQADIYRYDVQTGAMAQVTRRLKVNTRRR